MQSGRGNLAPRGLESSRNREQVDSALKPFRSSAQPYDLPQHDDRNPRPWLRGMPETACPVEEWPALLMLRIPSWAAGRDPFRSAWFASAPNSLFLSFLGG